MGFEIAFQFLLLCVPHLRVIDLDKPHFDLLVTVLEEPLYLSISDLYRVRYNPHCLFDEQILFEPFLKLRGQKALPSQYRYIEVLIKDAIPLEGRDGLYPFQDLLILYGETEFPCLSGDKGSIYEPLKDPLFEVELFKEFF